MRKSKNSLTHKTNIFNVHKISQTKSKQHVNYPVSINRNFQTKPTAHSTINFQTRVKYKSQQNRNNNDKQLIQIQIKTETFI